MALTKYVLLQLDPRKMIPDLTITLIGTVDGEDVIVQLLTTLAESISPHWRPHGHPNDDFAFIALACIMPVPRGSVPLLHGRGDCTFRIDGTLTENTIANVVGVNNRGVFTLTVESSLEFADGTSQRTDFSYERVYPGRQT
jgi:hypothetical protein